jgi:hypothetical protein
MINQLNIRRSLPLGLACLWLAGAWTPGLVAAEKRSGVGEYQVKATFLYNFTQFTDWPDGAFSSTNAPIVIGIVGEDPFGSTLDDVVRGEVVRGHPLVVKRLRADEDLRSCHVLFISRSEKERHAAILTGLHGHPVLTVSETDRFLENGGVVNLLMVKDRVRFEINSSATDRAGLKISSKLLNLATRVVKTGRER